MVPGIAGATLGDKTCPHVDDFLATMITNCNSRARGWVYDNDIVLNTLESWDKYSSNGFDLLRQLLCMQDKPGFVGLFVPTWFIRLTASNSMTIAL